jgi:hypothetical protein
MFSVWSGEASRPTKDIDLLGRIDNSPDVIAAVMKDACRVDAEADGMHFDSKTVTTARITENAEYEGVRARVQARLGNARVSLQVDIGFGDVVVPGPKRITYPALLDFPPPELSGYTMESTIAEKFQAMVKPWQRRSRRRSRTEEPKFPQPPRSFNPLSRRTDTRRSNGEGSREEPN